MGRLIQCCESLTLVTLHLHEQLTRAYSCPLTPERESRLMMSLSHHEKIFQDVWQRKPKATAKVTSDQLEIEQEVK